jgi:hypothetical protein
MPGNFTGYIDMEMYLDSEQEIEFKDGFFINNPYLSQYTQKLVQVQETQFSMSSEKISETILEGPKLYAK